MEKRLNFALFIIAAASLLSFAACAVDAGTQESANYKVIVSGTIENGSVQATPESGTEGTEVTLTATPSYGYEFVSFIVKDADGKSVEVTNGTFKIPAKDVTVSAVFTALPKYEVVFDTDGGNEIAPQVILTGEKVTKPENPEKKGYTFYDWYYDGESFDFDEVISGNITLLAKWNIITYYIEFNGVEGATNTNHDSFTVLKELILEDAVKAGATFTGWFDADGNRVTKIEKGTTGNIKLYARWSCDVTFDSDEGSEVAPQSVKAGEKVLRPEDPTKNGYTFDDWYIGDEKFDFDSEIHSALTITAKWNVITYTITYNGVEGCTNPNSETTYTVEDEIDFEDASKDGRSFTGWFDAEGNAVTGIAAGSTGNITIYAHWTCEVTFDVNGGSSVSSQIVSAGGNAEKPAEPTRNGYTFDDWYVGEEKFDFDSEISSNTSLTARWNVINYTITYNGVDGATNPNAETVSYTIEDEVIFASAEKTGLYFEGWTDAEGNIITKINRGSTGNVVIYASWKDGSSSISVTVAPNSDISISVPSPLVDSEAGTITLTADSGYTNYTWLIDGKAVSSFTGASVSADGKALVILESAVKSGSVYQISLSAFKGVIPYGAQISIRK